jgi:hypothetical protein
MQRRCQIEGRSSSRLVAHERCIKAGAQGIRLRGLMQVCEADGLIAKRSQNFLVPQQALAFRLEHQHRFAGATTGYAERILRG